MAENYIKGLVSVGIPTYNRPESLNKALKIITSQTYQNLEIIVSDNHSSCVEVKKIVEAFANIDSRIKFYQQEQNIGVLANAEFVLKKSTGEYFTWFSDDDWRSQEFIENMVASLEENADLNFSFCDYYEVYENGNRAKGYPFSHLGKFKFFQSSFRLLRIFSYYWQNSSYGKCNIFYGVFRKKVLDLLDLNKLTAGYKHLNMDNLIVFSMLQKGPVKIHEEAMCTLTCGNHKYYMESSIEKTKVSQLTFLKFKNLFLTAKNDRDLYIKNTSKLIEKSIIYLAFIPKFFCETTAVVFEKLGASNLKINIDQKRGYLNAVKSEIIDAKLELLNVTLVAVATRNVEETLEALLYSCNGIEFGQVKLLSHFTPFCTNEKIEFIRIDKMKNIDEWSHFLVYELNQYIDTEFILLVHADGFVVNPSSWQAEFLEYDYIGAPWPLPSDNFSYRDNKGQICRVGNSVSIRSKRLLELPKKLDIPWEADHGYFNEDGFICVKNKHIFEENGMKFAPIDVAKYFSHETMIPEIRNIKPFVFHKWFGSNSIYPNFNKKLR